MLQVKAIKWFGGTCPMMIQKQENVLILSGK